MPKEYLNQRTLSDKIVAVAPKIFFILGTKDAEEPRYAQHHGVEFRDEVLTRVTVDDSREMDIIVRAFAPLWAGARGIRLIASKKDCSWGLEIAFGNENIERFLKD